MKIKIVQGSREGQIIDVEKELTIGRESTNQLAISDPRISRAHAVIEKKEAEYYFKDLNSSNGSYINGKLIDLQILKNGDEIIIGNTKLQVIIGDEILSKPITEEIKIVTHELKTSQIKQTIDCKKTTMIDLEGQVLKTDQFKKVAKNLSILYKSGSLFSTDINEENLVAKVVDLIMEVIKADRYVVMFKNEKTQELEPKIIRKGAGQTGFIPIAISKSIIETVINENMGVICAHAGEDERFKGAESVYIYGIKSAMCVPIITKDSVIGLIYCDSLGQMGAFKEDDLKLLTAIAAQTAAALENSRLYKQIQEKERIKHELMIAKEIQQILLPQVFPEIEDFDFSFMSLEAEEVGGDYYDWFWIDSERIALVIADVSGKGVPGALIMAMFRSTLKSRAIGAKSPSELLKEVNNLLIPDLRQDMFISSTLVFLDIKKRMITFSRAGHLPLMIYRATKNEIEENEPKGIALGFSAWDENPLEERTLELKKGDVVIFYTDGVEEAQNINKEIFGKKRFIQSTRAAIKTCENAKIRKVLQKVINEIKEFAQGAPQSDDITLGLLKVN